MAARLTPTISRATNASSSSEPSGYAIEITISIRRTVGSCV